MRYVEVAPPAGLRDSVECLWSLHAGANPDRSPARVFPDGTVELIVHLGPPWSWRPERGGFRRQPRAFVVGQLTRPFGLRPARNGHALGARLRAAGARGVLGLDLGVFRDAVVPLDACWPAADVSALVRALRAARSPRARRTFLAWALLAHRDPERATHPAIRAAVETIVANRGRLRIAPLARTAGWSERAFERRFAREIGVLPRAFARTVRFQHLMSLVGRDRSVDWAGLAWDSGFADQAHLIREFRRFTGATPGRFRDAALALARRFVTPARLARYFADADGAPARD